MSLHKKACSQPLNNALCLTRLMPRTRGSDTLLQGLLSCLGRLSIMGSLEVYLETCATRHTLGTTVIQSFAAGNLPCQNDRVQDDFNGQTMRLSVRVHGPQSAGYVLPKTLNTMPRNGDVEERSCVHHPDRTREEIIPTTTKNSPLEKIPHLHKLSPITASSWSSFKT